MLQAIPVVLGVTIISFFVLRLIPGDPTTVMLGTHWTPARAAQLRETLGLNKPIWTQYYLFLPSLTIALGFSAILIRTLRNGILGILRADYIDTARAKGLSPGRLLARHILRNAMLSAVTVLGVNLSYLIGSTVVIENV